MKSPKREFYPFDLYFLILLTCFICLCIILCPRVAHGTKIITSSVYNICPVYVSFFQALAHYIYISKFEMYLNGSLYRSLHSGKAVILFRLVIRLKAISHLTNLTCFSLSMHIWYICHSILMHTYELLIGF